jgi:hypothetical protein
VSGSHVVWAGYDGNDYEIFVYDGSHTIQLTDNSWQDYRPHVSGSNVVWYGSDGSDGDWEIFFATYEDSAAPEPGGAALILCGAVGLLRRRRRRR